MNPIEQLAVKYGSDKRNEIHGYTEHYNRYFSERRNINSILEIGVFGGASVKMWADYFHSARVLGVDIDPELVRYKQGRVDIKIGDQADIEFLKTLGNHDIIIDDGGHTMKQQITSFTTLWDQLNAGGIYVIEDLHTSYWPEWKDQELTTINFLKGLLDDVQLNGLNGYGDPESPASKSDTEGYGWANLVYEGGAIKYPNIEYIHFYKSIVFIKKCHGGN